MFTQKLALAVAVVAVAFGGGAALAAPHAAKRPVKASPGVVSNVHYPCHNRGAHITPAQL